jgi:hypothetical protein
MGAMDIKRCSIIDFFFVIANSAITSKRSLDETKCNPGSHIDDPYSASLHTGYIASSLRSSQ